MADEPQFPRGFDPNEPSRAPTKRDWDAYCSSVHPSDSIAGFDKTMDAFEEQTLASRRVPTPGIEPVRKINEWMVYFASLRDPQLEVICHQSRFDGIKALIAEHDLGDNIWLSPSTMIHEDQIYVRTRPETKPHEVLPIDWNLTE